MGHTIIVWIFTVVLAVLVIWIITLVSRVVVMSGRYRRIARSPIANWGPPESDIEPVAFPPIDSAAELSEEVDADGVYVVDYDALGQRGVAGRQRNPANIAVFAIKCARKYIENGDATSLALAARQFSWLEQNARPVTAEPNGPVVWCAEFDLAYQFNARAPWRSAYGQSFCVLALVWASRLFGERRYRDLAHRGVLPFGITTASGGLCFETEGGGMFFEEIVCDPLHHILNGHMTALINLFRFARCTDSGEARRLFERGVRGTIDMLPAYDRMRYSLYSLSPNPGFRNHFNIAGSNYHHKHVAQLRTLHSFTGNDIFREYADKWERRSRGPFDYAWTAARIAFKDVMRLAKSIRQMFQ